MIENEAFGIEPDLTCNYLKIFQHFDHFCNYNFKLLSCAAVEIFNCLLTIQAPNISIKLMSVDVIILLKDFSFIVNQLYFTHLQLKKVQQTFRVHLLWQQIWVTCQSYIGQTTPQRSRLSVHHSS